MSLNKKSQLQSIQQLVAGIQKRLASGSMILANETFTGPELVTALQPLADALTATTLSRAAYLKDIQDERDAFAKAHALLVSLNQAIYVSYGNAADALADFGLAPRTRSVPTAATKASAAAKSRATRVARGEVGAKKKDAIEAPAPPAETPAPLPAPLTTGK